MRAFLAGAVALAMLAGCEQEQAAQTSAPDAVFVGGAIHTGVDGAAAAEAVSVKDGRIVAVGTEADILASASETTQRIDLGGAHLYPGFTDAHVHISGVGEREMTLNLDSVKSLAEMAAAVKTAADAAPGAAPLVGRGWIETHWPEKRFPNRDDLDAVTGDRPAAFVRADGHAMVVNSAALKAAGVSETNPESPSGGRIEVDAQGRPTGMLIDNAMGVVGAVFSGAGAGASIDDILLKGADVYLSLGWTGGHNMSADPAHVARMNALAEEGRFGLRVYNAIDGGEMTGVDPADFGTAANGLITTKAIKLYMDGALGSRGALLKQPYSDQPGTTGLQLAEHDKTLALMKQALAAGIQICFHAIGDKGNALVLDWMEETFGDAETGRAARWRIEHAQVVDWDEIIRFVQLGVIPSMQPSHAIGDLHFAADRLSYDRLPGAYAWRAMLDSGSIIAGGSDAPVERGDPRIEFYAAVSRRDTSGFSAPHWQPQQVVTREEALKMFTLWPAYASFRETDLGTIEPGKLADFTAFSADILTIPEAEILTVQPRLTVVNGEVKWRAE